MLTAVIGHQQYINVEQIQTLVLTFMTFHRAPYSAAAGPCHSKLIHFRPCFHWGYDIHDAYFETPPNTNKLISYEQTDHVFSHYLE